MVVGRLTSEALVRGCLSRIGECEPIVRAWAHMNVQAALSSAQELDRAGNSSLLSGIPIGWKDIIDCAGMPTACGSPIDAGHIARKDAGAAEAAGVVPLAIGTHTGGFVIRRASFCGVVGLKPSFGLISRAGVNQLSDTLDTAGTFTRIENRLDCTPSKYDAALARRRQCHGAIENGFGDADLLLVPSAPGAAPAGLRSTGKSVFNRLWTDLGLPCITLPGHRGTLDFSVGVQLIARSRQDVRALAHAAWIEDIFVRSL